MNNKHDANYCEVNGIVWMKKSNHSELINPKSEQLSAALTSNLSKMEPLNSDNKSGCDLDESEPSICEESCSDQDLELNDDDVWDDSLLIKMYEASQKQINDELAKRFSITTSDTSTEQVASCNENMINAKKYKQKVALKKAPKAAVDQKPVLSNLKKWKEGDFCQLTYLEDNVDYEAKIVSINNFEQNCLVRYIGYENEEIRNLVDLKQSEGEKVRKLQIEMAIQDGYGKPESSSGEQIMLHELPTCQLPTSKPMAPIGGSQMAGTSRIIPPPPPFLTENLNGCTANNANESCGDDDDVLASMLMSWYMTGYHTGYYQARKDMKNNR